MPRLQAIVLDFDGVVVESLDVKTRAFAELFRDHPDHVDAIVAHHRAHPGVSRYEKFRYIYANLLRRPLTRAEMRRLDRRFSALVRDAVVACPFVKGARPFLRFASARVPVFVASATPQAELRWIVRKRELTPFFAGVYGSPTSKVDAIGRIGARLGVHARDMLFVGDAASDRAAARATGARFIARVPEDAKVFARPFVRDLSELHARLRRDKAPLQL